MKFLIFFLISHLRNYKYQRNVERNIHGNYSPSETICIGPVVLFPFLKVLALSL